MSIIFYAGSGSTPSWKVWLSLEYKQIPYEVKLLSFQAREHRSPEFLAVNPRGKVPAIQDGDFALWESSAIVEYLEEKWPERPLLPRDVRERARVRRLVMEADLYMGEAMDEVASGFRPGAQPDPAALESGRSKMVAEARRFDQELTAPFFAGETPSLADFAVYPMLAFLRRVEGRSKITPVELGGRIEAWMKRIEAQPWFEPTYPPHWRG